MHDGIPVIGRDHDDLVVGQHFFELAYFGQPARPFGHFGQSMQFAGFGLLEFPPVPDGRVLAHVEGTLIFVLVGSGRHQGSCAAEIVLVGDLDTTVFALDHIGEGVGPEFTTARAARWAHVGQVHHEGIVHGKLLVGVQEGRHLVEQMPRGPLRVAPISHPDAGTGKIIGQAVGSQVDLQIIVVVPWPRLVSDGLAQGANHFLRGVARAGLALQASPERLPGDAERGAVTDGVGSELELQPATGLSFGGLQRLQTRFVVAAVAGGRQTFVALQLASTVPFVAVRGRLAGGALKGLRKNKPRQVSPPRKRQCISGWNDRVDKWEVTLRGKPKKGVHGESLV